MLAALASVKRSSGNAKTDIVVPVCSVVPVAVSDPAIIVIIVPGPAAQHSVEAVSGAKVRFFFKNLRLRRKKRKKEKVQRVKE